MNQGWLHFVEARVFTEQVKVISPEILQAIQSDLIEDPKRWPVVAGTNGARKGRVADPRSGQGKRGGFRYMYLYLEHRSRIHLLFIYGKRDQADLSPKQKKWVAKTVSAIQREAER